jgi:hypothetical protein
MFKNKEKFIINTVHICRLFQVWYIAFRDVSLDKIFV